MVTGLTPASFNKLVLNAGVMLKNFDYSEYTTAAALADAIKAAINGDSWIGATRGGCSFSATPSIRDITADGMRSAFVGSTFNDGWDVSMSATLIEMTSDSLKMALGSVDSTKSGDVTTITLRTAYKDSDYIENIVWIGDMADGGFVLIEIENALAVSGLSMSFSDKGEGEIPIKLKAHQASVEDQDTAPCKILLFGKAA